MKDGGLALPKGVIAGVSIESFFRTLAPPSFGVADFNKLPIPFRAMATDIETGEAIALERGSVAQAMRASMSVPGAIAPVEIDGRLLVDGGIANNLPINEVRKLCADVVIAVNISTPPLKRDEITSALTVVGPTHQLPRQADGRRAAEEPGRARRAHRPGARRHLGRQVRPLRGRHPHRGGGDSCDGRAAQPVQPAAGALRGVSRHADRRAKGAGQGRRNPRRRARTVEPRGVARVGGEQAGRAAHRGEDRRRPAPRLRARGLREHQLSHHRRRGAARHGHRAQGKIVGAGLPAFRPRSRERLPGRQPVQPAGPVSQDLAQPPRRRVGHRGADRAGHLPLERVLPADDCGGQLVCEPILQAPADDARPVCG